MGEIKPGTDKSFKQFTAPEYGYRAAFVILGTYLSRGINTIEKIIKRWAPPEDNNNTELYIWNVALSTGIAPEAGLNEYSGSVYKRIVAAMAFVENGQPANMNELNQGFSMQYKIK